MSTWSDRSKKLQATPCLLVIGKSNEHCSKVVSGCWRKNTRKTRGALDSTSTRHKKETNSVPKFQIVPYFTREFRTPFNISSVNFMFTRYQDDTWSTLFFSVIFLSGELQIANRNFCRGNNREQRKKTLSGRQEIMVFRVFFSVNAHA